MLGKEDELRACGVLSGCMNRRTRNDQQSEPALPRAAPELRQAAAKPPSIARGSPPAAVELPSIAPSLPSLPSPPAVKLPQAAAKLPSIALQPSSCRGRHEPCLASCARGETFLGHRDEEPAGDILSAVAAIRALLNHFKFSHSQRPRHPLRGLTPSLRHICHGKGARKILTRRASRCSLSKL